MLIVLAAAGMSLSALQAGIAAPTDAFRGCLRQAAIKAKADKVSAEGIEAYLKNACNPQMGTLNEALIAFRLKNGMTRKQAASDAAMTVDDYVSTPVDNYKFMLTETTTQQPATASPSVPLQPIESPMKPAPATVPPTGSSTR